MCVCIISRTVHEGKPNIKQLLKYNSVKEQPTVIVGDVETILYFFHSTLIFFNNSLLESSPQEE